LSWQRHRSQDFDVCWLERCNSKLPDDFDRQVDDLACFVAIFPDAECSYQDLDLWRG